MKIGILTFHYPWNYGAVLQAYASVQILKEMGHEPDRKSTRLNSRH